MKFRHRIAAAGAYTCATALLATPAAFAQGLRLPVAPQAIESHLEQQRTLEQLEQRERGVIETPQKTNTPVASQLPARKSPAKKKRLPAQAKPGGAQGQR